MGPQGPATYTDINGGWYSCDGSGYLTACYNDGVTTTSEGKYILWCTTAGQYITEPDCPYPYVVVNNVTLTCDDANASIVICLNGSSDESTCQT